LRKHAKGQLFYLAEYEIEKKLDAINILKQLEQVKTIKQILLNEDQMYLLELRGNKVIKNNPLVSKKEFKSIVEDKKEKKDTKVIEYLKKRQINQEYDEIDDLLVCCLNDEYKIKLKENGIVV
jgi:DNA mismatch repair ATPase MutS